MLLLVSVGLVLRLCRMYQDDRKGMFSTLHRDYQCRSRKFLLVLTLNFWQNQIRSGNRTPHYKPMVPLADP